LRRGARAAEWGGLENRCGFRVTVGSNPTLSAFLLKWLESVSAKCERFFQRISGFQH
jgi:hypothetical protein